MTAREQRKSAFVPRLLVRTAIASVVPACAVACGSGSSGPAPSTDAATDSIPFSVAAVAYPAYESGVPDANTDGGSDAAPDSRFFAVAYPAYEAGNG
jgi:hypothetical protein